MVETFPGRRAHRQVAGQANGAIGKSFPQVEDLAIRMVGILVPTLARWVADVVQGDEGLGPLETDFSAEPLVSLAVKA